MRPNAKTVLLLNGSPRARGNTAVLLAHLESALARRGRTVIRHDLYRMKFRGCAHCDHCKQFPRAPACKLQDDFLPVLQEMTRVGSIVLASPVYCWSVSGCLGAALDRFYAVFKDGKSLIAGKRIAGVFTAGGDAFDGMDLCVEMLKRICEYGQADYVGTLAAVDCGTPAELRRRSGPKEAAEGIAGLL